MLSKEATVIQSMFHIQNKEGTKVPFALNTAQQFYDKEEGPRIIIAKARQKGFSSIIKAKFSVRCLGRSGTHAVVMSHEASATQRHMDQVQYFLKHLKGPDPVFGRNSRNELYFPKMESTYYIGTAGARAFGRGDWVTDLHCSEYAFWEDAEKHAAGIFQAVPITGRIIIESTGNGRKGDFFYIWKHADGMGYKRLFYPWYADTEYELDVTSWKPDFPKHRGYLLELQKKHNLSPRKMAWYEKKFKELRGNLKMMQQEYPSEPMECFQATGGALFNVETAFSSLWKNVNLQGYYCYRLDGHPKKGWHYVIGADPSGGTGNDDAALQIFCCETQEQVLELFNAYINPIEFARIAASLGKEYNEAYIVPEGNNHGIAMTALLKELYPKNKIFKSKLGTRTSPPKYGWWNSNLTKHAMVGLMTEHLDETIIYGQQTADELNAFEEVDGKMEGDSDNCVIATGLAMMGLKRFAHLKGTHIPSPQVERPKPNYMTYTLDEVIANISKRTQRGYFKKQVGEGYPYH